MTHLDDAHAALMHAVTSDAGEAWACLPREQARALLDEAARLVAERDAAIRASERPRAARGRTARRLREWREIARSWRWHSETWQAEYRAAVAERDEARAVLRPLLEHPINREDNRCVFCRVNDVFEHEPDCPVLRRAALLGEEA